MAYSKASNEATKKYKAKYDIIQIRVPQGKRQILIEHARLYGESMNAFISRAIDETIQRDCKASEVDCSPGGSSNDENK